MKRAGAALAVIVIVQVILPVALDLVATVAAAGVGFWAAKQVSG